MRVAPVSVVIPAYNSAELIGDAIDSILAQTMVPAQIIVIDDGSKDNTAERLASYLGRILYRVQDNAGPSAARNHGIRLATEQYVAFLDADDVWHPRKLELQMLSLELNPQLGMLATDNFDWPVAAFPQVPDDPAGLVTSVTWEQLVIRTMILTSTVIVRRDLLDCVGEFDCSLCGPEDRDLFLRIAEVAKIGMLQVPLTGYRDSVGSLTKHAERCENGMRKILRQLDDDDAWKGRWILRRKSYSYMHLRCSAAQARAGNHVGAALKAIKSIVCYPIPYKTDEVRMRFERPKRLAVNLLRLMHLRAPDPGPGAVPTPDRDALDGLRQTDLHTSRSFLRAI